MDNNIIDKRTEGEWRFIKNNIDDEIEIYSSENTEFALCTIEARFRSLEKNKSNAAFICKAVNEYDKLKEQNNSLLEALKEIAVPYPDNMSAEQDNILCKYLIARAQEAISKIKTN